MEERKKLLENHRFDIWQSGKDGTWYTYLPDPIKKRRQIKSKDRERLEKAITDFYAGGGGEKPAAPDRNATLRALFPGWLAYKQSKTDSPSCISRIASDWKRFYETDGISDIPIAKLTKLELDEWVHGKIKDHSMTRRCWYNMSMIIRQGIDYAKEKGIVGENLFRRIEINKKLFRREKKPPSETQVFMEDEQPPIIEEMMRMYREKPQDTAPLAVLLAFETGLRVGELTAIKKSDVSGTALAVQRQQVKDFVLVDGFTMKQSGFRIVEHQKSSDDYREAYLSETALSIIGMVERANEEHGNGFEDFLFAKGNRRLNCYDINDVLSRGCKAIGIAPKRSHKIRKTYISALIDAGVNIDEVRRMVGHRDERTTYGNYCFNRRPKDAVRQQLESVLNAGREAIKGNQDAASENGGKPHKTRD
jgi:integrase